MTDRIVRFGDMTEDERRIYQARQALHRNGASPAGALELLAATIEDSTWERVVDGADNSFRGRFREFVESPFGLGMPHTELTKVIALRHPNEGSLPELAEQLAAMRAEIDRLLKGEIRKGLSKGHKTKRTTLNNIDAPVGPQSENVERELRRLKRVDLDLAEKVVSGEMSAYAASRAKGWRPPRIEIRNAGQVARKLREHMKPDQLAELVRLLTEET